MKNKKQKTKKKENPHDGGGVLDDVGVGEDAAVVDGEARPVRVLGGLALPRHLVVDLGTDHEHLHHRSHRQLLAGAAPSRAPGPLPSLGRGGRRGRRLRPRRFGGRPLPLAIDVVFVIVVVVVVIIARWGIAGPLWVGLAGACTGTHERGLAGRVPFDLYVPAFLFPLHLFLFSFFVSFRFVSHGLKTCKETISETCFISEIRLRNDEREAKKILKWKDLN